MVRGHIVADGSRRVATCALEEMGSRKEETGKRQSGQYPVVWLVMSKA